MNKQQKNIIVLGGGTAGLLTALWAKKHLPKVNITILKSKGFPSVGVGEASTPSLVGFLRSIDIDPLDLVKNTGGTIKNGISFENWSGEGSKYFHGFEPTGRLAELLQECNCPPHFYGEVYNYYTSHAISKGTPLDKVLYSNILAYGNKVDVNNASWALQFDAIRVAKYLTDIALSRGIKVLEGTYSHTIDTSEGFISKISLEGGRTLSTDFVFDCSGFARLLIGKKFKQPWDSYSKFLPAKEAIPFRLPVEKPLTPYTKAIAMKYGWMWSIPLQDMTGCGYTYDTDYINAAEAQKEVEEFLGIPITPIKVINFETGQYRKVWVKNCLAIGLSTGFAEPLESTSVHMSISQLEDLKHFLNHIFTYNEESQESYNKNNYEQNRAVLDFIYLHYLTVRKDTPFWRDFRANHPTPPSFKHLLKLIEERNLRFFDINRDLIWKLSNYLQVSEGLELPTKPINIEGYTNLIPSLEDRTGLFNRFYKDAEDHAKFMNNLLGTPNT